MKAIICKVLSVLIALGGAIVATIDQSNPVMVFGFVLGGFIAYELAILMENKKK